MLKYLGSPPPSIRDAEETKQRHLSDDVPKIIPKAVLATPLKLSKYDYFA